MSDRQGRQRGINTKGVSVSGQTECPPEGEREGRRRETIEGVPGRVDRAMLCGTREHIGRGRERVSPPRTGSGVKAGRAHTVVRLSRPPRKIRSPSSSALPLGEEILDNLADSLSLPQGYSPPIPGSYKHPTPPLPSSLLLTPCAARKVKWPLVVDQKALWFVGSVAHVGLLLRARIGAVPRVERP